MLHYGMSMGSFGGFLTPDLADALRRSTIQRLELILIAIEEDDQQDGPGRSLAMELLADGAIQVDSLHLPFGTDWNPAELDEARRRQAVARMLEVLERGLPFGAQLITLHASWEPVDPANRERHMEQVRRSIAEMLPFLQRTRMRLAVELLPRTCIGNHESELLAMTAPFDPAQVGICLDLNHVMERYAELPRTIETLGERLYSLHVSDYDGVDEKHWFPGQGIIDWPAVMHALDRCEQDLHLFYETRRQLHGCDPIFSLRQMERSTAFLEACRRSECAASAPA